MTFLWKEVKGTVVTGKWCPGKGKESSERQDLLVSSRLPEGTDELRGADELLAHFADWKWDQ